MKNLFTVVRFIWRHPLNRRHRCAALVRFLKWQIASRLFSGGLALPFVADTTLIARNGMTGASGNYYCGLQEYEDMAFLLHLLRPGDLFVDVGANIGSYTVLAAGAVGADVIAIEPVPETFLWLLRNITFNGLVQKVTVHNIGLSNELGTLVFSTNLDTGNHVLLPNELGAERVAVRVNVSTLDEVCQSHCPILVKIDVEGYERQVLSGANRILADRLLAAVIIETNGCGKAYGTSNTELVDTLRVHGFSPSFYEPQTRRISAGMVNSEGNTLFIRDIETVRRRVEGARTFTINGQTV